MKMALFFTYNTSLKTWAKNGMIDREILLYQGLAKKGLDITFVTYGDSSDYKYQSLIPNIHILPIYALTKAPSTKLGKFLHSFTLPSRLKKYWKSLDLIKTNQMFGAWVPLLAKKKYKTPFLVRCGYEFYELAISDRRSWINLKASYFLSKTIYHRGDKIVVTSKNIAKGIQKRFSIPPEKLLVFPNYIDTHLFKPIPSPKKHRVLCIGRLHPHKNLHLLIIACAYNHIGLDLVGEGSLKNSLKQLTNEKNADVNFLGSYLNKQLPELINQYTAFALCSSSEGSPKGLLEAMSCGLACLGVNVSGINNVIENNKTGLLCELDQEAINQCLKTLLSSEKMRHQLGIEARKYIEKHCSLDAALEKELALYKELCPNAK